MDDGLKDKLREITNIFNENKFQDDQKLLVMKLRLKKLNKMIDENKTLNEAQINVINDLYNSLVNLRSNHKRVKIQQQTSMMKVPDNIQVITEDQLEKPKKEKPPKLPKKSSQEQKEDFYKDFMGSKVSDKKWLKKQVIQLLHKEPKKNKDEPTYQNPVINGQHQADVLFLPYDNKKKNSFKYLLVVSDVHTRLIDAQPMISKDADEVLRAFNAIYSRKVLKHPIQLITDGGGEFKGSCLNFYKKYNIFHKPQKTGKKIGIVDAKIKIIGNAIIKKEVSQQLLSKGEWSADWDKDIPEIVKLINEWTLNNYEPKTGLENTNILYEKDGLTLIPLGTKVRVASYYPKDYHGNRLSGKFRSADIKWDLDTHYITDYIIRPNSPIMYVLDNDRSTFYTKNSLQIVSGSEEMPPETVLRKKQPVETKEKKDNVSKKHYNKEKNQLIEKLMNEKEDDMFIDDDNTKIEIPQYVTRSGRVVKKKAAD